MTRAVVVLYVTIGLLSIAVVALWIEQTRATRQQVPIDRAQGPESGSNDHDPGAGLGVISSNSDQDRRISDLEKRINALALEVDQLRLSVGRSPAPVPPPTEAEFMEQHRASLLKIVDEEQKKRTWSKAIEDERRLAGRMVDRFNLPEILRPQIEEFGSEYMRRVKAIIEKFRDVSPDAMRTDPAVQYRWTNEWDELWRWAEGRCADLGGAHASEMQAFWAASRNLAVPPSSDR